MNPDNPYAAPQTSHLGPLPLAEDLDGPWVRRLFPECDTEQLLVLAKRSRWLAEMQMVWMMILIVELFVGLLMMGLLLSSGWANLVPVLLWLGVFGMTLLRFVFGNRHNPARLTFCLMMDGLFTTICLLGTVLCLFPLITLNFGTLLPAMFFSIASTVGWRTCKVMVDFPELFNPGAFPHKELIQEANYRRKHNVL